MSSIILKSVLFVTILIGIIYLIFAIWIHNKQSNNEPVSDSVTQTAFWLAIVLLIWFIGMLVWIITTFLNKKVVGKLADVGNAIMDDGEESYDILN
uniref:Uncharacterized protein n=1 Tax=Pithovirus LCPAC403 TaxID=2506596 RepID=A0A481ZAT1_9VIRU|nr:MAG: uncharacterized protein LCPAC403_01670 [Pithovirus LCPAC403]